MKTRRPRSLVGDATSRRGPLLNKLGAELGVRGMTLYYCVANKDDVLDGLVDLLWSEIDPAPLARTDWRSASTMLAHAVHDLVHRHPPRR